MSSEGKTAIFSCYLGENFDISHRSSNQNPINKTQVLFNTVKLLLIFNLFIHEGDRYANENRESYWTLYPCYD